MMKAYETPAITTMRWLGLAAVGVLLAAIGGILAISAGITDPTPAALPTHSMLLTQTSLPAGTSYLNWLATAPAAPAAPSAAPRLDVRLTAAWVAGDPDAAYGLILGDADVYLAAAVSPAGYVSLWLYEGGEEQHLLPWQTWPHVRPGAASNEIQMERQGEMITIRINREWLWTGLDPTSSDQVGIVVQSFTNPTTIQFERLQMMAGPTGK